MCTATKKMVIFCPLRFRTLVFGQSGRTKGPLLFFLGSVLLWAYPMYFLRVSKHMLFSIVRYGCTYITSLRSTQIRLDNQEFAVTAIVGYWGFNFSIEFQCVPVTWENLPQTHYTFIVVNIVMWISLLVANQKDPGFLGKNTDEYHR